LEKIVLCEDQTILDLIKSSQDLLTVVYTDKRLSLNHFEQIKKMVYDLDQIFNEIRDQ